MTRLRLTLLATTALAVDSVDVMLRKIFGTDAAPIAPPLSLTSHALVGKDNTVVVNAYHGALEFQGSTYDSKVTTLAITNPSASRTVTFPDGSGTVSLQRPAVLAASGAVRVAPAASVSCYTLTPGEDGTINAVTTGAASGRPSMNISHSAATVKIRLKPGPASTIRMRFHTGWPVNSWSRNCGGTTPSRASSIFT